MHTISAYYNGSSNFFGSSSNYISQVTGNCSFNVGSGGIQFRENNSLVVVTTNSPLLGPSSFSVAFWFRMDVLVNPVNVFVSQGSASRDSLLIGYKMEQFVFSFNTSGDDLSVTIPSSKLLKTWHYLVATYDGLLQTRSLFLDGQFLGQRQSNSTFVGLLPLTFGGNNITSWFYNGALKSVRIYSRVLTSKEIELGANAIYDDFDPQLQALFEFTENSGSIAKDSAPFGLNALASLTGNIIWENQPLCAQGLSSTNLSFVQVGNTVNFTAQVFGVNSEIPPQGIVRFLESSKFISDVPTDSKGSVTFVFSIQSNLSYSFTATFLGAADFSPSSSLPQLIGVNCRFPVGINGGIRTASSRSDYIRVSINPPSLNSQSFSLSLWHRLDGFSGSLNVLLSQGTSSSNQNYLHFGYRSSSAFTFDFYNDILDASININSLMGGWHHWAGTYDAGTRSKSIYLDGVRIASAVGKGNFTGSGNMFLGGNNVQNWYSTGALKEVRIFTRTLNSTEVGLLALGIANNEDADLKTYFGFFEQSGLVTLDTAPNGGGAIGNLSANVQWEGVLACARAPTSITLISTSPSELAPWNPLTLIASLSTLADTAPGQVSFMDSGLQFGSAPINASGIAVLETFNLSFNTPLHYLTAVYSGNADFFPSNSLSIVQIAGSCQFPIGKNGGVSFKNNPSGYVKVTQNSPALNAKSFSLSIWSRVDDNRNLQTFFAQGFSGTKWNQLFFGFRTSTVFSFDFWGDALDVTFYASPVGQWRHWAGTYDQATRTRKLYLDGVQIGQNVAGSDFLGTGQLCMGGFDYTSNAYNGGLKEARIYYRVLNASEISQQAMGIYSDRDPDLKSYFGFFEQSGLTTYDTAPYGLGGYGSFSGSANWENQILCLNRQSATTLITEQNTVVATVSSLSGNPPGFMNLYGGDFLLQSKLVDENGSATFQISTALSLANSDNSTYIASYQGSGDFKSSRSSPIGGGLCLWPIGVNGGVNTTTSQNIKVTQKIPNPASMSFTISAWSRVDEITSTNYFIGQGSGSARGAVLHFGYRSTTQFTFDFMSDTLNVGITASQLIGSWHHWAGTYEQSTRIKRIYLDGVLIAQAAGVGDFVGTGPFQIGGLDSLNAWYKGGLKEVRVYYRMLNSTEIARQSFGVYDDTDPSLKGYFGLFEQSGLTAYDTSPMGLQSVATLGSGVRWSADIVCARAPTNISLSLTASSVDLGTPLSATVQVTSSFVSSPISSGNISVYSNSVLLTTFVINSTEPITFQLPWLNASTYSFRATYTGAQSFLASNSSSTNLTVRKGTSTTLLLNTAPVTTSSFVTYSATVASLLGIIPTGSVQFSRDGSTQYTVSINGSGQASTSIWIDTSKPTRVISANYVGDSNFNASSTAVSQIVGACPFGVGKGGLQFPRASNSFVLVTSSSLTLARKSFSISLWFRIDSFPSSSPWAIPFLAQGSQGNFMYLGCYSQDLIISFSSSDYLRISRTISTGIWHHLAVTYDQVTRIRILYYDGSSIGTGSALDDVATSLPLTFGGVSDSPTLFNLFNGALKALRIYSRVLTASEILAHSESVYDDTDSQLQAYFAFTEGNGNNTYSKTPSGSTITAVLNGFVNWDMQLLCVQASTAATLTASVLKTGGTELPVTLTARVSAVVNNPSPTTISGNISFSQAYKQLATIMLDPSGTASYSLTLQSNSSSYSFSISYLGNTDFLSSNAPPYVVQGVFGLFGIQPPQCGLATFKASALVVVTHFFDVLFLLLPNSGGRGSDGIFDNEVVWVIRVLYAIIGLLSKMATYFRMWGIVDGFSNFVFCTTILAGDSNLFVSYISLLATTIVYDSKSYSFKILVWIGLLTLLASIPALLVESLVTAIGGFIGTSHIWPCFVVLSLGCCSLFFLGSSGGSSDNLKESLLEDVDLSGGSAEATSFLQPVLAMLRVIKILIVFFSIPANFFMICSYSFYGWTPLRSDYMEAYRSFWTQRDLLPTWALYTWDQITGTFF